MLSPRPVLTLTFALFVACTPTAHAGRADWVRQLGEDFRVAQQVTRGQGATVAILSTEKRHGTLLASFITRGGRGLAPGARVLPVRVLPDVADSGGEQWSRRDRLRATVARGIRSAADRGSQVICVAPVVSGGYTGDINKAVAHAQAKGAVVVAANAYALADQPAFPAATPGVIGAGALNAKGERDLDTTQNNSATLVAAPGVTPASIGLPGPAVAATFVAAAAALVKSAYPRLTPAQVREAIAASARHPKGTGAYDTEIGFGVVNPDGALTQARRLATATLTPTVRPGAAHLGGKTPDIAAAKHPAGKLAGFGGLAAGGVLALGGAVWLASRRPAVAEIAVEATESGDARGS